MKYRSRQYDTATGRFLQQDSYRGDVKVAPSLHRCVYTLNNPVRYVDPTGHFAIALPILALGAIAFLLVAWYAIAHGRELMASALALLDDIIEYMRNAFLFTLAIVMVAVAFFMAHTTIMWKESEGGDVVPFPGTIVETDTIEFDDMDENICLQRYIRSKEWIMQNYPDFAIGSKLVFYAYKMYEKCVGPPPNPGVIFPGEGPFPMPPI